MTIQFVRCAATTVAILAMVGCDNESPQIGDTIERTGQPPITYVEDDDPEMEAAIAEARATVARFVSALNNPLPSQADFSVKMAVTDGETIEHMWLTPVRHQNGEFVGAIGNDPSQISTVAIGDEVRVTEDQISDWMYVENQKLVGGFTLRALRNSMTPAERADLDRSVPFAIE